MSELCSKCDYPLSSNREIESGLCDDCFNSEHRQYAINRHNQKVESARNNVKLSASQKRVIETLKDSDNLVIESVNYLDNRVSKNNICKPMSKTWDNGQVDSWLEPVKSVNNKIMDVIATILYLDRIIESDKVRTFVYSWHDLRSK